MPKNRFSSTLVVLAVGIVLGVGLGTARSLFATSPQTAQPNEVVAMAASDDFAYIVTRGGDVFRVQDARQATIQHLGNILTPLPAEEAPVRVPQRPPQTVRPAPPPQPAEAVGVIRISLTPAAIVLLDGVDRGELRRLVDTLKAGEHHLRALSPGYAPIDTAITIRAGEQVTVRIVLRREPGI